MQIYEIIVKIIERPDAVNFYKNLRQYYETNKKITEVEVLDHLIRQKFKNESSSTDFSKE